jgi:peptide/nickel transport system substrate-binding protein
LKRVRLFKNAALFNEHLDLNCENPILGQALVRRALALATNRKELSDKVYDGLWLPAYGDDHPRSPYYSAAVETLNAFDPARSMALLSKAGWVDRDGDGIREKNGVPLALTISTTTGNLNRERTEMVLREQYRAVGVDLRVKNYTPGELYASWDEGGILRRGTYAIALYAALMPPDPSTKVGTYSAAFLPPTGQNFTRIRDERLTRLLAEGSRTIRFADRKRINDEVASIVSREAPAIPLLWVTQLDIMPQEIVNYRPNPTQSGDTWNANEWWLKR